MIHLEQLDRHDQHMIADKLNDRIRASLIHKQMINFCTPHLRLNNSKYRYTEEILIQLVLALLRC